MVSFYLHKYKTTPKTLASPFRHYHYILLKKVSFTYTTALGHANGKENGDVWIWTHLQKNEKTFRIYTFQSTGENKNFFNWVSNWNFSGIYKVNLMVLGHNTCFVWSISRTFCGMKSDWILQKEPIFILIRVLHEYFVIFWHCQHSY